MRKMIMLIVLSSLIITGCGYSQETEKPTPKAEQNGVPTNVGKEQEKIKEAIKKLGSDDWSTREAATKSLEEIGEPALELLRQAKQDTKDPEIRWRAETALVIIERNIRFANLKISPALKNKIEALLKQYPDKFLLVSRAMMQQEDGSFKPLQGVKVDVTVVNSQKWKEMLKQPLPPDSPYKSVKGEALEPSDEDGIFVILLDEEKYTYHVEGTGITHTPETEEKVPRWYHPEEIKAKAGNFIIIPDVEFVKEMEIVSPKRGEEISLKSNPVFKWKAYLEASYYKIDLGLKGEEDWCLSLCRDTIKDGKTSITWDELVKKMSQWAKKDIKIPGDYSWQVIAYDKKGRKLSGKHNNHFHLTK